MQPLLLICSVLLLQMEAKSDGTKMKKRGKKIVETRRGDVLIKINRKKWEDPKERLLCCPLAHKHCKAPCKGVSCQLSILIII